MVLLQNKDKFFQTIYVEVFMDRIIRNSAKALIIKDGKMLAIKIKDKNEEWYIMPGGGQETEELLSKAVCREVAEELGMNVEAKELVFVIEGVHGERFHRVDMVFLCEYIGEIENAVLHSDTNQVGYDWLEIKMLNHLPLYPSKLRRQIMNLYEGKEYKVYLGNEGIGDPEVTD
jgi:ADP-ribose pyrophosphatase YjhB (NUDIX family)